MDSSVWSKLPEDLQGRILAYLPLDSLAQFQLVCKNWKARIQNRHFLRERSEAGASSNSWFVFWVKQEPALSSSFTVDCYNTHSNKWHELRLGHLRPTQQVCTTSGSLLLCVGGIDSTESKNDVMAGHYEPLSGCSFSHMMICNPLKSNSWEKIDLPLQIRRCFNTHIGMVADTQSVNYKIIIQRFSPEGDLQLYDSRQKSWKSFHSTWCHLHDDYTAPVEYRGQMLFLGKEGIGSEKMFMYNLEHNTCNCFDIPFARNHPGYIVLRRYVEICGGRLLMVKNAISNSKEIFEVQVLEYLHREDDLSDGVWEDLTFMPILELERLMSVNSKEGADFLADSRASSSMPSSSGASLPSSRNDLLCIAMGMKGERLNWSGYTKERAIFLYSLSQNLWCFVGRRPHWSPRGSSVLRSLEFQPSFLDVSLET